MYVPEVVSHIKVGDQPKEAENSNFIAKVDQLFNWFNSGNLKNNLKPLRGAISENSNHNSFLSQTLIWINSVIVPNSKQHHFLDGWKLAISSLMQLWEELSKICMKFLLNQSLKPGLSLELFLFN